MRQIIESPGDWPLAILLSYQLRRTTKECEKMLTALWRAYIFFSNKNACPCGAAATHLILTIHRRSKDTYFPLIL
jgi:hypothetical protein